VIDRSASSAGRPVVVVSRFLPDPRGWAASRILDAFVRGAHALGRDLTVWSWWPYEAPRDLPSWVRWDRLPREAFWRMKLRALVRPRADVVTVGWEVPDDVVALADDPLSFPAVRRHPRSVLTMHYSTALDRRAIGSWRAKDLQDLRFENAILRRAVVPTAYSERVAEHIGRGARVVPAALAMPRDPLPARDAPVATCVADWSWPPNRVALDRLVAAWPLVREQLPAAQLLLAGPGEARTDRSDGVRTLGRVPDSAEVLAESAALVFPSPDTSGPKVKVMEAVSLGLPVVTTPAGIEGLAVGAETVDVVAQPATPPDLAAAIVAVLSDPARAAQRAAAARASLVARHSPEAAAAARLAVIDEALAAL
jgi:glycosyltransferase involved in cell wall biosynthesis